MVGGLASWKNNVSPAAIPPPPVSTTSMSQIACPKSTTVSVASATPPAPSSFSATPVMFPYRTGMPEVGTAGLVHTTGN